MWVSGTRCRALLDIGAVPNILSKELVERLGVHPALSSRHVAAIPKEKSAVVGTLKGVALLPGSKVVTVDFLVMEQSPYDMIICDPMMEKYSGFLDLGILISSFVIYQERVEVLIDPDYVDEDPGGKSATDIEDFTSVSSAKDSEIGERKRLR